MQLGLASIKLKVVITIDGVAGKPKTPVDIIDCGNSGQVLRFIGAIAGLCDGYCTLTGDHSIQTNRPAQPLLDGLNQLGAIAESSLGNGFAPLHIKGPIHADNITIDGADSQPVSGLLIALALTPGRSEIHVTNAG